MRFFGRYLVLLAVSLWPLVAGGQPLPVQEEVPAEARVLRARAEAEIGLPFFFEHFTRQDYRQHHQNWAIAQDPRGVIYVGNYDGILEYDGASWRLIETPTKTIVRSLAIDAEGRVFVGTQGDFGYLEPDSTGTLHFVSLRGKVDPADQEFWDVWGTHVTNKGVFFQTTKRLFLWDGKAMTVWESEPGFHTSFWVRDQLFVREWGVGLLRMVDDTLQMAPDGERFADLRIYMMAPYDDDHILIATRQEGLFLYDGNSAVSFPTEVDRWWRTYRLYHGRALPDGHFALTFLDGGGAVVIDKKGRLVQRFDESTGLPDGWVNYVFSDAQGGLWMALNDDGIVRVDFSSPLSFYDRKLGLEGRVNTIKRHQGQLYVATTTGVYRLEEVAGDKGDDAKRASFVEVLKGTSRALLSANGVLFVATDEGLFALRENQSVLLTEEGDAVFALLQSSTSDRIYFGKKDGLALLEPASEGWAVYALTGGGNEQIVSMAEDTDGTLWFSTAERKVLHLRFSEAEEAPYLDSFGEADGLPQEGVHPALGNGEVIFSSIRGIFRYGVPESGSSDLQFYLDPHLHPPSPNSSDLLLSFSVDDDGSFWLVYPDRVEIATPQAEGSYARAIPPVLRFPKGDVVPVYVEEDGIAWFGDGPRLIRYDPHFQKQYDTAFAALVRKVTSGSGQPIFGGTGVPGQAHGVKLDYAHNSLRFEFAAPSYNAVNENQYQYYLEGHDAQWSDWTYRKNQPYHGLKEGRYGFRVRARNAQGVVSEDATFAFRILPPWYRTGWAYGLYFALILGATALYWRYRTVIEENKQAQEQVRALARERVVNERLQQANRRLQEANESLTRVNKLKDEFLATTSHELRTPLTAILGFAAVLQEELPRHYREFLDPIESNGHRLLQTVNSLLELAKLRAGMMEIRREIIDVGDLVQEVNRLLAPLAYRKALLLEFIQPPQPLLVNLDRHFLERILNNLVGNAIKFTKEGVVSVNVEGQKDRVLIRVADTGIGIDESFIPQLFDEFKQESSGLSRSYEGSGLGLSITARLVELMEGTIHVESEKGRGSVFTVFLPVYRPPVDQPFSAEPHPVVAQ